MFTDFNDMNVPDYLTKFATKPYATCIESRNCFADGSPISHCSFLTTNRCCEIRMRSPVTLNVGWSLPGML